MIREDLLLYELQSIYLPVMAVHIVLGDHLPCPLQTTYHKRPDGWVRLDWNSAPAKDTVTVADQIVQVHVSQSMLPIEVTEAKAVQAEAKLKALDGWASSTDTQVADALIKATLNGLDPKDYLAWIDTSTKDPGMKLVLAQVGSDIVAVRDSCVALSKMVVYLRDLMQIK